MQRDDLHELSLAFCWGAGGGGWSAGDIKAKFHDFKNRTVECLFTSERAEFV